MLRVIVLMILLVGIILLGPLSYFERIDTVLISQINRLMPPSEGGSQVLVVQYEQEEIESEVFNQAVDTLVSSSAKSVTFFDVPPGIDLDVIGKSKVYTAAVPYIPIGVSRVNDPRGITYLADDLVQVKKGESSLGAYLMDYPAIILPQGERGNSVNYPAYLPSQETLLQPLFWQYGAALLPDLAVMLAENYLDVVPQKFVYNQANSWIYIKPAEKSPLIMPLSDISAPNLKNKIVLIGQKSRSEMMHIAARVESLLEGQVLVIPSWFNWVSLGILTVLFLFSITLGARLSIGALALSYLLLLVVILSCIIILAGFQSLWVPMAQMLLFLLVSLIVTVIWNFQKQSLKRVTDEKNSALIAVTRFHIAERELGKAYASAVASYPHLDAADLMYEIGIEYEKRRQYDKALECFQHLKHIKKRYKDLKEHITHLQGLVLPQAKRDMGETLVMTAISHPQLGRYEIESEIGRGAMGVVYLGYDPKIQRRVAIKTLDYDQLSHEQMDEWRTRFFREAEAAGRLSHPNIVTVYDVGEEGNLGYIAMDYVPGPTLEEFTNKKTLLPLQELLPLMVQVARALGYAHRQGIIHRDIKPGNIILNREDNRVKVTDFGVARIGDTSQTRTGIIVGSPSYMAPEQFKKSRVDGKADLFSLGVTIYQLLSGHLPFDSDDLAKTAYLITNEKHRPIRELRQDLPRAMSIFINKALQKLPKDRYETGEEMAQALQKMIEKSNQRAANVL